MQSWCIGREFCWLITRRLGSCVARSTVSSSTSTKTQTPLKCGYSPPSPVTVAMWSWSVTRTSRSMRFGVLKPGEFWTSKKKRTARGEPAPVFALGVTRRFGPNLLAASRNVADRLGLSRPLPPDVLDAFRNPAAAAGLPRGTVEIYTCGSAGAEAEHIADMLRSAHLRDGLPWTQMAVLVTVWQVNHSRSQPGSRRGWSSGRGRRG